MDIKALFEDLDRFAELLDIEEAKAELEAMAAAGPQWTKAGKEKQRKAELNFMFAKGSSVTYKGICRIIQRHISAAERKKLRRLGDHAKI